MASNSRRRSGSSARTEKRKRVEIPAADTVTPRVTGAAARGRGARGSGSNADKRSREAARFANAKRQNRERRQAVGRLKAAATVAGALLALAALGWGLHALFTGPAFQTREIEVRGTRELSRDDVLLLAEVPPDVALLELDTRGVRRRVQADPWVESAQVSRRLPDTLVIEIVERVPGAIVDTGGADLWIVSVDGHWLGTRTTEASGTLSIREVGDITPEAGERVESEVVMNAVKVASGLSPELRARTRMISAPTIERTALILDDETEVFIGEAEDLALKDRIAREILAREKRVVYINVRVPSSPTWRGLGR